MTDQVLLRDVIETDLLIFYEQQLNSEATQMAAFPSREKEEFWAIWETALQDKNSVQKTILFAGQVAGHVVSFVQDGERQVGYWLGKEYWGQGIASRALAEFLNYERVRPLYAHVARHNVASRRVLEKCSFVEANLVLGHLAEGGEDAIQLLTMELK